MSETKKRQHRFTGHHPYLSGCLFGVLMWLISGFSSFGINRLIHMAFADYPIETGPIGIILGSLLALSVYWFWFRPEFEGHFKGGSVSKGFQAAIPYFAYLIFSFILDCFFVPGMQFHLITPHLLFNAIAAGFLEETIFRGGLLTTMMRKRNDPKRILTASLISSLIFGLFHLTNISSGGEQLPTIFQTVNAFTTGIVDAMIYLVSGNILVTIAIHTLHDIIAFSFVQNGSIVSTGPITWETWLNFALCTALGIYAVRMLCEPAIQTHISEVWSKKWNTSDTPDSDAR